MTSALHDPEDLQRSALLRQLLELDRLEPPPELDRAVLEAARQAIKPVAVSAIRRSPRRLSPALRWALSAGVTAVGITAVLGAIAVSTLHPRVPAVARREVARRDAAPLRSSAPRPSSSDAWRVAWHVPLVLDTPRTAPRPPSLVSVPLVSVPLVSVPRPPRESRAPYLMEVDARASGLILGARAALESRPDEWLGRIRQLRAEGRTEDAAREWTAFRKIYPGYPGSSSESFPGALSPVTATARGK